MSYPTLMYGKKTKYRICNYYFQKRSDYQFTSDYLNFQSHCGLKRKVNLIRTLCHRANLMCSPELFEEKIYYIKTLLYRNAYPLELVRRTIKSHLNGLKEI